MYAAWSEHSIINFITITFTSQIPKYLLLTHWQLTGTRWDSMASHRFQPYQKSWTEIKADNVDGILVVYHNFWTNLRNHFRKNSFIIKNYFNCGHFLKAAGNAFNKKCFFMGLVILSLGRCTLQSTFIKLRWLCRCGITILTIRDGSINNVQFNKSGRNWNVSQ